MPAADTRYINPFGEFALQRYPARAREPLQAWCAADTLLLDEASRLGLPSRQMLVVNDEHGALCVALQPAALWTDSALAAAGLRQNLAGNARDDVAVHWSTAPPPADPVLVLLRVPKQLPYFEYQLAQLGQVMPTGTRLLAAGMDKHLSPRVAPLLEKYIGPTERRRGQRKARLFSAVRDERPAVAGDEHISRYHCEALGAELQALPNVFSRDKLDLGSRLLLAQLDGLAPTRTVLDLACGNGVLGLAAMRQGLADEVSFCDESAMALESARRNAARLFPGRGGHFFFHHGDGLANYTGTRADLILCNPPFHLNHTVDEFAGRRLLEQCAAHLSTAGRLYLVANRHLNYLPVLRRGFQRVENIAGNSKFTVWLAQRG